MTLVHIGVFIALGLIYSALIPGRWRGWLLLVASVIAVYALQPALTIRFLDFVLPTTTLVLMAVSWWLTRPEGAALTRDDKIAAGVILALVLALSANRYLAAEVRLTPSRPPDTLIVALTTAATFAIFAGLWLILRHLKRWNVLTGAILVIVVIFAVIKTEPLAAAVSLFLRAQTGQSTALASAADLGWLGFSYVAFRLIHTLRERQTGKLPSLSLREYATYVIFFPTLTAGPIDRAERFVKDDRALTEMIGLAAPRIVEGGTRIAVGMFKKFVIADCLAQGNIVLNASIAAQTDSTWGLWLLVYGFAFQLFFDFSGYTDIAIGIGMLYGIRLPENFDRPYLKQSLTAFWQSWHRTLSDWARFYVFSPLSRALLTNKQVRVSPTMTVLIAQLTTMLVIGLWHGVTVNFVLWGLWHGVGLFVHKLWSDRTRAWYLSLKERPRTRQAWTIAGVLTTFHYVALGWVWFALADTQLAARVFLGLFGIRS